MEVVQGSCCGSGGYGDKIYFNGLGSGFFEIGNLGDLLSLALLTVPQDRHFL